MGCLGNIIWMLCGGLVSALGYLIAGCIWCITIVGIPVGMQCFKLAGLALFPFGKDVTYGGGLGSFLLNIIWAIFFGIPIALHSLLWGCIMCITIIGIPFVCSILKWQSLLWCHLEQLFINFLKEPWLIKAILSWFFFDFSHYLTLFLYFLIINIVQFLIFTFYFSKSIM